MEVIASLQPCLKTSRALSDWRGDRPETPVTLEDPHLQGLTLPPNQTPSLPLCPLPLFIFIIYHLQKLKRAVGGAGVEEEVFPFGA